MEIQIPMQSGRGTLWILVEIQTLLLAGRFFAGYNTNTMTRRMSGGRILGRNLQDTNSKPQFQPKKWNLKKCNIVKGPGPDRSWPLQSPNRCTIVVLNGLYGLYGSLAILLFHVSFSNLFDFLFCRSVQQTKRKSQKPRYRMKIIEKKQIQVLVFC